MTNLAFEKDIAAERLEVSRMTRRLDFLNRIRYFSLPMAALSAVAAIGAPVVFPVVAGAVAVVIGVVETIVRKERKQLDAQVRDLESRSAFNSEEVSRISYSANSATVAGSSS